MANEQAKTSLADDVNRLREGEITVEDFEDRILDEGQAAIPLLLELIHEPDDADVDVTLSAAHMLGALKAEEAIAPLIELVRNLPGDDMLHDRAILSLSAIGPPVVEPILALWDQLDDEVRSSFACALSDTGVKDERVYQLLVALFAQKPGEYAADLAAYGDKRALPLLLAALDELSPDAPPAFGVFDLCDAVEELGGTLTPAQEAKRDAVHAALDAADLPLTPEEEELAAFLDASPDAMTLPEAKGLFTALATGPTLVPPSEWLDLVIGDAPAFESPGHARQIAGVVMTVYNQTVAALDDGTPLIKFTDEDDVADWAVGFADAVQADAAWMKDPTAETLLDLVEKSPGPAVLEEAVREAARYWLAKRRVPVRVEPKVGRNEPCPCGSGKKYKKCCEAGLN